MTDEGAYPAAIVSSAWQMSTSPVITSKRPPDPMGFVALFKQAAGVIASTSGREARDEGHRGMERDLVAEAA
jgi:hypothetical protein